jgi:hypothetical protein
MTTVKTKKYLNDLLEKNYDAQHGCTNASEVTEHVQLKRWLPNKEQDVLSLPPY